MDRQRIVRTAIQALLAGGLSQLIDQVVVDVPDRYDAYVILLGMVGLAWLQAYADAAGIPYPLSGKLRPNTSSKELMGGVE